MRKYVVPIVALAGIALLSSSAYAATDLIVKSRAIPPGGAGSLPVIARNAPSTGLWGIDAGITFSSALLKAGTDPFTANAKTSGTTAGYDATKDVAVSGTTFVGTGTQPNVYFGYVRGATAIAAPTTTMTPVGLLKLSVDATATRGTVINLGLQDYNVKNTGDATGSTRKGATAATVNASNQVVSEDVALVDAINSTTTAVPMHKVGVGIPGDVSANGAVDPADIVGVKQVIGGTAPAATLDYRRIAGDVAPANGYVPGTDLGGTAGAGYGDMVIQPSDIVSLRQKIGGTSTAFPVAE
jgi:hypothetical protein